MVLFLKEILKVTKVFFKNLKIENVSLKIKPLSTVEAVMVAIKTKLAKLDTEKQFELIMRGS